MESVNSARWVLIESPVRVPLELCGGSLGLPQLTLSGSFRSEYSSNDGQAVTWAESRRYESVGQGVSTPASPLAPVAFALPPSPKDLSHLAAASCCEV